MGNGKEKIWRENIQAASYYDSPSGMTDAMAQFLDRITSPNRGYEPDQSEIDYAMDIIAWHNEIGEIPLNWKMFLKKYRRPKGIPIRPAPGELELLKAKGKKEEIMEVASQVADPQERPEDLDQQRTAQVLGDVEDYRRQQTQKEFLEGMKPVLFERMLFDDGSVRYRLPNGQVITESEFNQLMEQDAMDNSELNLTGGGAKKGLRFSLRSLFSKPRGEFEDVRGYNKIQRMVDREAAENYRSITEYLAEPVDGRVPRNPVAVLPGSADMLADLTTAASLKKLDQEYAQLVKDYNTDSKFFAAEKAFVEGNLGGAATDLATLNTIRMDILRSNIAAATQRAGSTLKYGGGANDIFDTVLDQVYPKAVITTPRDMDPRGPYIWDVYNRPFTQTEFKMIMNRTLYNLIRARYSATKGTTI